MTKINHREELAKLYAIIEEGKGQVSREYVQEKLEMALFGMGIGIHPILQGKTKNIIIRSKELQGE